MSKNTKEIIKDSLEEKICFVPDFNNFNGKINYENLFIAKKKKINRQIKRVLSFSCFFIILLSSLAFFTINNIPKDDDALTYKELLNADSFIFHQETTSIDFYTFEDFVDLQYNKKNQRNFYKISAQPIDEFYTCAYIPTENYQKYINFYNFYEYNYVASYDLIQLYKKELKDNNDLPQIHWIEYDNLKDIPLSFENYSLTLILKSRNIIIETNESYQKEINFKKRLYINTYYQIIDSKINFVEIDDDNILSKLDGTYIWVLPKKEAENKNEAFSFSTLNSINGLFKLEKINEIECVTLPLANDEFIGGDKIHYGKYYEDIMNAQITIEKDDSQNYGYFDYNEISKIIYK